MAFMVGSFANGLFSGAGSVANLYGMWQGIQTQQMQLDAANAVKDASAADERDQNINNTVDNLRQQYGTPGAEETQSPAPDTTGSTDPNVDATTEKPAADPSKVTQQPKYLVRGQFQGATPPGNFDRNGTASAAPAGIQPTPNDVGGSYVPPTPAQTQAAPQQEMVRGTGGPVILNGQGLHRANEGETGVTFSADRGLHPSTPWAPNYEGSPLPQPSQEQNGPGTPPWGPRRGLTPWGGSPPPTLAGPTQPTSQPAPPQAAQPQQTPQPQPPVNVDRNGIQAGPARAPQPQIAPAPAPTLGGRILGAINPVGTAEAATPAPGGGLPVAQQDQPGWRQQAAGQQGAPAPAPAAPTPTGGITTTAAEPAAPASPQAHQTPAQTQAGPVAVQGATVAPNQQGPSLQSETTPTVVKPPFDPRPYAALAEQRPDQRALIDKVANENGVTPQRLALHWWTENQLKEKWTTGAAGEIGPLQLMPSTIQRIDPGHTQDPTKTEGSLTLAAREINLLDREFGQDSPSSVLAYQGGPGTSHSFATNFDQASASHPKGMAYLEKAYPGVKLDQGMFTAGTPVNWKAAVQAGVQQGPDGFLRSIVQTGPRGMGMTDLWRHAETALMAAAAAKGDYAGMQHAQDFVFQMSHQGALSNMIAADKALLGGDSASAAQYLAKAHAFFPDGTYGRFGVDKSGQVWAERLDEHTGVRLGQPFQVTHEGLTAQLIATQNPMEYLKLVQEQQKTAAALRLSELHGDYYANMPTMKSQAIDAANTRAAGHDDTRLQVAAAANNTRLQIAAGRENDQRAEVRAADTAIDKAYTPDSMPQGMTPEVWGNQAEVDRALRTTHGPDGSGLSGPHAMQVANSVVTGKAGLRKRDDGTYAVVDPKNPDAPMGYVPWALGDRLRLAGSQPVQRTGIQPTTPVGAGAASPAAMMSGANQSLTGQPQSSAIPAR